MHAISAIVLKSLHSCDLLTLGRGTNIPFLNSSRLWIAGSSTKVELTTLADRQSSLQRAAISIGTMSSHRECLDFSRFGGWQVRSLCRPHSGCSKVFATSLSVLALRRRYGGCIFERAGSHVRGQERTVLVMILLDAFSCVSTSLV